MKNKYQRLDKEGKKKAREELKKYDAKHHFICKKLNNLKIGCLFGIIFAIGSFFYDYYIVSGFSTLNMVFDGLLLVFCLVVLVGSQKIFEKQVNLYLIERDNDKKKLKK